MTRQVLIHNNVDELVEAVGARLLRTAVRVLSTKDRMHVVLTGGTVGIGILAAIARNPARESVDWSRVHLWWGDERWVAAGHADRNDQQAKDALLGDLDMPKSNIHSFPASDEGLDLDEAARSYAAELAAAEPGSTVPHFDVLLLGVGPDGHIASLFPDRPESLGSADVVVPVRNSPKPPPERLSLTLDAINTAERVWIALAGSNKASALGLALAGASPFQVPVAGAAGRRRTVFFVDQDAAAEVPDELIASNY